MFKERVKEGINVAKESFAMVWHHPNLIIYMALASLLVALANLFLRMNNADLSLAALIPFIFLRAFVITFFTLHLVRHTLRILRHHTETSVKKDLGAFIPKIQLVAVWSAIIAAIHTAWSLISITTPSFLFVYSIGTVLLILWTFATLLVIPLMTGEDTSIFRIISLSIHLVKNNWVEILSGQALILLGFIPAWLVTFTATSLIRLAIAWPIESIMYTVQGIFVTLVYYYFYRRPQEEIDILRFPEM